MKKTLIATAIMATALMSTSAFAGKYDSKPSDAPTKAQLEYMAQQKQQQQQNSNSSAEAYAGNAGNSQSIYFQGDSSGDADIEIAKIQAQAGRDIARQTQRIENTPSVSGPSLTTSNDTCMGSTSGSINIAGLGIGGGTSWTDDNCVLLKNSRELWNMGMKGAAMARMCHDDLNKEALELTGYVCPQTARAQRFAAGAATEVDKRTEAYVRPTPTSYVKDDMRLGG